MSKIPKAIGPYSAYRVAGDYVFISGQLGIVPETGEFIKDCVKCQTRQAMTNITSILEELGLTNKNIVKTTILLKNINDFAKVNEVYAEFLEEPYPARAAYEVAALPKGGLVEIEAIVYKG